LQAFEGSALVIGGSENDTIYFDAGNDLILRVGFTTIQLNDTVISDLNTGNVFVV
jgi:Ca2+-binding RTX toxin-like protein